MSKEALSDVLSKSGWRFTIENDCTTPKNTHGDYISICRAEGLINGYNVSIHASVSSYDETRHEIAIDIRPSY